MPPEKTRKLFGMVKQSLEQAEDLYVTALEEKRSVLRNSTPARQAVQLRDDNTVPTRESTSCSSTVSTLFMQF